MSSSSEMFVMFEQETINGAKEVVFLNERKITSMKDYVNGLIRIWIGHTHFTGKILQRCSLDEILSTWKRVDEIVKEYKENTNE